MKIWHISDTHELHEQLIVPENIDVVIHSGDATNPRDPIQNAKSMGRFLQWYSSLYIPKKIFVAGNHDTCISSKYFQDSSFDQLGITYLEEDSIDLNGYKVYGDWAFMTSRATIFKKWEKIPDNTDLLITHGPPLGILDTTLDQENNYMSCGDSALLKRIKKINISHHFFGHVHDCEDIMNSGIKIPNSLKVTFSNGSCGKDGNYKNIVNNGNILDI
jgi:Icc-related predicted phosphoesterase